MRRPLRRPRRSPKRSLSRGPGRPFARRDRRRRSAGGWLPGVVAGLATLGAFALLVLVAGIAAYRAPGPRAASGRETVVLLRHGAGLQEIAAGLQRARVISAAPVFVAAAQLAGAAHRLKAGEYAFPSRLSLAAVIGKLRRGEVVHHRVTVPEGLTSQQAVDILARNDVLSGPLATPPEGSLLPETYEVVRGEQRSAVLQRMMDARDRLVGQLWLKRRAGLPYTSVAQAATLASIVEKETALASERPRVAAVYLNRLRAGMKLEADPTVAYGVSPNAPLGHGLTVSELKRPTPYNTYANPGLPPTPIDNPGRASLAAALDPPDTRDLYFVADGSGGHAFAATLADHGRNVARWRRIEHDRLAARPATPAPAPALEHP